MKILLYTDAHLSLSSSIITGRQGSFDGRLSNLIESFKWVNELGAQCDYIINLGDTVDKPILNSEEITALNECNLSKHIILLGNHDISSRDGVYNAVNLLGEDVVRVPRRLGNTNVILLPYSDEQYDWTELGVSPEDAIVLSHNDIAGIAYGKYISQSGYTPDDILKKCRLFINGHIHTGQWIVRDRIMNLGLLTGLNFGTINSEWYPGVAIIDTDTYKVELIQNPHAYVFHKKEARTESGLLSVFDSLPKNLNNVLQIKVPYEMTEYTRELVDSKDYIKYSRVLTMLDSRVPEVNEETVIETDTRTDYEKLRDYLSGKSLPEGVSPEDLSSLLRELESADESNI